ncbi:MAG: primosomal protein N' [Nocardioides sp.]
MATTPARDQASAVPIAAAISPAVTSPAVAGDPAAQPLPGLVRAAVRRPRGQASRARVAGADEPWADVDPIARVLVDVPLAHLDREFDYAVPSSMAETALPGVRVRVRFAGRECGGFVLDRVAGSPHGGRLTPLRRVVSAERVLVPEVAELAGEVAARYAGTRSDVLRLAIPPRHARAETAESVESPPVPAVAQLLSAGRSSWSQVVGASAFLSRVGEGGQPRAVWAAAPGDNWPLLFAYAAAAAYSGGRGVIVSVPDTRDLARVDAALTDVLGAGHHVTFRADAGPAARYRDFLAVSRGTRRIVAGTRSAAFAPVHDLGLVMMWDDGDDLYAEPRAPYPHTREVLLSRAARGGHAVLLGAFARSVEADGLVRSGWARAIAVPRAVLRERATVVASSAEIDPGRDPHGQSARLPRVLFDSIRRGLATGPVLVQSPRAGYAPSLACERCRRPARCGVCTGALSLAGKTVHPACAWCGSVAASWACPECGHRGLRAPVVGGRRTSEELGRAFPGVAVRLSDSAEVVPHVPDAPALVVATPGAEPVAAAGYAAVILLDTWLPLTRVDLRVDEEALRRWLNAGGLLRPGGEVMVVGESGHPAIQALIRWDPAGFAARESEHRAAAHLPPAARIASITGAPGAIDDAVTLFAAPPSAELLGPAPVAVPPIGVSQRGSAAGRADAEVRVVVRVPKRDGPALSAALGELQRLRSVRKLDPVRIQVDPPTL